MMGLQKTKVNLGFLVNPFYLFVIAFTLAIFVYSWGWCKIFPEFSTGMILFFLVSFILFIFLGSIIGNKDYLEFNLIINYIHVNDIIFLLIFIFGFIDVILMGFLPILDRSHDYRDFGVPVIDPVFNTLSIFFSVFFFQTFLESKKKRFLIYVFIILIIQFIIFRRSTMIWILTSSTILYIFYNQKIHLLLILAGIVSIPFLSYCFGLYGNTRSNLSESYILNDLGASDTFRNSGFSHNHLMTYLYLSSPLANLQKNIVEGEGILNRGDAKNFIFYSLLPQSLTLRLEKQLKLEPPTCNLITPGLIAGSFLMVSFYTMGWPGMILMLLFLVVFIVLCLFIIKKFNTFGATTYAILSTTVCLLIFSNFLIRADVILMLFFYPVLFHFVYTSAPKNLNSGSSF